MAEIQVKPYANAAGKKEGKPNRVQITMDIDDARKLGKADKSTVTTVIEKVKSAVK